MEKAKAIRSTSAVQDEEFLSDSPFRAVNVGSSEPVLSLRKKVDSASKAFKVGLVNDVPMSDILGPARFEELPSLVRKLASDGKLRTCYRIMWPMSADSIALLDNDIALVSADGSSGDLVQLCFLSSWLMYLVTGSPTDAAHAFERWLELYSSEAIDDRLVELLVEEDGLDESAAFDVMVQAEQDIARTLLSRVCRAAASCLEVGETTMATLLVRAVLESQIDKDLEEQALEPVSELLDRLCSHVASEIREMAEWRRGGSTDPPRNVIQLERMAVLLSGRLPSSTDWMATALSWNTGLVWKMRSEAMRLHKADDNPGAIDTVCAALEITRSAEQKQKLQEDLRRLKQIVEEQKLEAAFQGIEKVSNAPFLSTINGFGCRLYGNETFAPDNRFYFSTLYLTAVFIPIFPISRFLVRNAQGGGWHFLGRTRWTIGMKIHLAASVASLLLLLAWLGYSASPDHWVSIPDRLGAALQSNVSESSDSQVSGGTPTSNDSSEPKPEFGASWQAKGTLGEERRSRLERELEGIKWTITSLKDEIREDGRVLESKRSTLEALRAEIDLSEPNPYNQNEIDAHNRKVRKYEELRSDFNTSVESYNRKVSLNKRKVQRHNEIVEALNAES